jgi:hypothetical protein
MGPLIFVAAGIATAYMEHTHWFAHVSMSGHAIAAAIVMVPAWLIWALLRRLGAKPKGGTAAPRSGYGSFGQPPSRRR